MLEIHMLLFLRRCRYWHLHLHVHASGHFTLASRRSEHVGLYASLANCMINHLHRHCTFLRHSTPPPPLHHSHSTSLACLNPQLIKPSFPRPSHFPLCPSLRSHHIKHMCNVARSWFGLPLQPAFQWQETTQKVPYSLKIFVEMQSIFEKNHLPFKSLQGVKMGFTFWISGFTKVCNCIKGPSKGIHVLY